MFSENFQRHKINFLDLKDVLELHKRLMEKYGGGGFGVRDTGLLDSAINQTQPIIFGQLVHKDIFEIAAAYSFYIIKNHPFVDGNKRTGMLSAMAFLKANGVKIKIKHTLLYEFAIDIAASKASKEEIALFFKSHSKSI